MSDNSPAQLVPYVTGGAFILAFRDAEDFIAIVAGSAATMKYQVWRIERQG